MSSAEQTQIDEGARPRRRWSWRRRRKGILSALFTLCFTALLGLLLYVLIGRPVPAPDWLRARIEVLAAQQLDGGRLQFDTLEFVVEDARRPGLRMTNVAIITPGGVQGVGFAELRAGLSLPHLVQGKVLPSDISVSGVFATLRRKRDGSVALSGGFDLSGPQQQAANFAALIEQADTLLMRPEFAALTLAEIQALTLRIEDARTGRAWTIDGGRLRASRDDDVLRLTSDLALLSGGEGVATLAANYESRIGSAAAAFGATVADVDAGDIAALAPPFAWLDVLRAPISGAMRGGVDQYGALQPLSVTFSIGEGVIQPTDATRPVPFRSARSYFSFDPALGLMRFDELSVISDWITGRVEGETQLNVGGDGTLQDLVGQLTTSTLVTNPAQVYPQAVAVESAQMDFRMSLDPFRLEVGQARVQDQGRSLVARGTLEAEAQGWRYAVDAQLDAMTPERLFALWPETVLAPTRDWLVKNLIGGEMRAIDVVVRDGPQGPPNSYLSFAYDNAEVRVLKNLPPVTQAHGTASLLDNRFVLTVDRGQMIAPEGGAVDAAGSSFIIPDVTVKGGAPAVVRLRADGPVTAALSLLDQPPLEVMRKAGLLPALADGRLTVDGTIALPLVKGVQPSDVTFNASGEARNVVSTTLIDGRTLRADRLRIEASNDGVSVSGPGTLDGVPFDVTWRQPLRRGEGPQPSRVSGTIELSPEAIRAFRIGLPDGMVRGRGTGSIVIDLPVGDAAPSFELVSDLRGLRLSSPPLGWAKDARAAGTLQVTGQLGPTPRIDRLSLGTPGLNATGSITLTPGGGLERARFSEVRVGDWLRAPVDLVGRGAGAAPGVEVRGGTLDLRRADFGGSSGGGAQGGGPLSLALDRLVITDTIRLDDMRGDFNLARGLDGRFTARVNGGTAVAGQVLPQNGRSAIRIQSQDAGGVFASSGLLKQARGGDLSLTLLPVGQASFDGTLQVTSTRIKDAPAIAALLNAASIVGLLEQMNGGGIHFQEVEAAFRLTPSTMALTRASAVGPSMGLSMDGTYDVNSKVLNMQGVISPIFLLNGIGSILTRKGEGLIGFNYRLRGPASDPKVSVNPLSALTPGMFREIFRAPAPKLPEVDGDAPATAPEAFAAPQADQPTTAQQKLEERNRAVDQR